jgi:di/tripeptidase
MTRETERNIRIRLAKLDNLKRQLKRAQDDLRERQVQAQLIDQDYRWSIARLKHLIKMLNQSIQNLS